MSKSAVNYLHTPDYQGVETGFLEGKRPKQQSDGRQPILIIENHYSTAEMLAQAVAIAGYTSLHFLHLKELSCPMDNSPLLLVLGVSSQQAVDDMQFFQSRWRATCTSPLPALLLLTTQPHLVRSLEHFGPTLLKPFHMADLLALIQVLISKSM